MSEATLQEHLRLASLRAKTYTNSKLVEFNTAVVDALEEMADLKADKQAMTTALAGKADKTDTNALVAFFNAAGLYVDEDGDIAQTEEEE